MAHLTPTERLEWLLKQSEFATAAQTINAIIKNYQIFLESMDKSEDEQIKMFLGPESSYSGQENEFGNLIYRALKLIGKDSLFYRLLVV